VLTNGAVNVRMEALVERTISVEIVEIRLKSL